MKILPHGCMNDTPTPKKRRILHEDLDGTHGLTRVSRPASHVDLITDWLLVFK